MNVYNVSNHLQRTVCMQPSPKEHSHVTLASDDDIPHTLYTRRCHTGISLFLTRGQAGVQGSKHANDKCQQTKIVKKYVSHI